MESIPIGVVSFFFKRSVASRMMFTWGFNMVWMGVFNNRGMGLYVLLYVLLYNMVQYGLYNGIECDLMVNLFIRMMHFMVGSIGMKWWSHSK